eukprot:5627981-Heterocapsa_arctica.AAC.1
MEAQQVVQCALPRPRYLDKAGFNLGPVRPPSQGLFTRLGWGGRGGSSAACGQLLALAQERTASFHTTIFLY